jgi:hypothetical protein
MKGLKIAFISIYLIGLFFKVSHYPGASLLLIIGGLVQIVDLIKVLTDKSTSLKNKLAWGGALLLSLSIIFKIQFWGFHYLLLLGGIIVSIIYTLKKPIKLNLLSFIVIILITSSISINLTPKSKIYYAINLSELFNGKDYKNLSYYGWDKYSWYLYNDGEYEEAKKANDFSLKILNTCIERNFENFNEYNSIQLEYRQRLIEEGKMINNKSWDEFVNPFKLYNGLPH